MFKHQKNFEKSMNYFQMKKGWLPDCLQNFFVTTLGKKTYIFDEGCEAGCMKLACKKSGNLM